MKRTSLALVASITVCPLSVGCGASSTPSLSASPPDSQGNGASDADTSLISDGASAAGPDGSGPNALDRSRRSASDGASSDIGADGSPDARVIGSPEAGGGSSPEGSVGSSPEGSVGSSPDASFGSIPDAGESGSSHGADGSSSHAGDSSTSVDSSASDTGGQVGGGSGAYIRQYSQMATPGDSSQDQSSSLNQPVLAGSTVLVFVTEYNIKGNPPGSAPPDPIAISDSDNVTYTLLNIVNDQPDWEAVMSYARYNVTAGPITVKAHFAGLEWQALLVVEVANVPASPLIASAGKMVMSASATADSITSGPMAAGSAPALVVGFATNCSDQAGHPNAGTGFTSLATVWNWNGTEGTSTLPSSILEYEKLSNPGSVAATFTPVSGGENFCAFAVALQD